MLELFFFFFFSYKKCLLFCELQWASCGEKERKQLPGLGWGKAEIQGKCDSKQWTPDLEPRPLEQLGLRATSRAEIVTAQVSRGGVASQLNVVQTSVPHTWKSHDAWAGHQHPGPRPAISLRTRPAMMRERLPDKGRTAAFLDTGKHLEMSGWRKWQN